MPRKDPPRLFDGRPRSMLLPAGRLLWRVHNSLRKVQRFSPVLAGPGSGGGRFDATEDDKYGYWYAAYQQTTSLAEVLLRSLPFDETGYRLLSRDALRERRVSAAETTCELRLISLLSTQDLAAVGQEDDWLVQCEPGEFTETRRWAHWLRRLDDQAAGLIWQSRRDRPHEAVVLFEDRCGPAPLEPSRLPHVDLDTEGGITWLEAMLRPYRVLVGPPA
jgi:hypothetical protein